MDNIPKDDLIRALQIQLKRQVLERERFIAESKFMLKRLDSIQFESNLRSANIAEIEKKLKQLSPVAEDIPEKAPEAPVEAARDTCEAEPKAPEEAEKAPEEAPEAPAEKAKAEEAKAEEKPAKEDSETAPQ